MIKTKQAITNINLTKITNQDKVFLQGIAKRHYMLLKDMYAFHDAYPSVLDGDLMSSYDTLFRVLADICDRQLALNS